MIRSVFALLLVTLVSVPAFAEEPAPAPDKAEKAEKEPEKTADAEHELDRHRTPVEVLSERMIGSASRAVRFDWRRTTVGFAFQASELLERNNFGSTRLGGHVRHPFGNVMGELGVNWVFVSETDSTRKLALTPYRQDGRPERVELDFNVAYPVAEGVATAWPGFFPATELVFSGIAGLRYSYYPGSFDGATFTQVAKGLLAPRLGDLEMNNLEKDRPGGMQIDPNRYALLVGMSLDIHFQTGGFLSPRAMAAIPVFAIGSDVSTLGVWWELSCAVGWAF